METSENNQDAQAEVQTSAMEAAPPKRRTVWTSKQRIIRLMWGTIGKAVWTICPCLRSWILRRFGATIGSNCEFARNIEITIPWNLTMGDHCKVAEHAILYNLGTITLGNNVRIDTRAHLCAGTHDMRDTTFPLLRPPITVHDDSYIGVDAYIAPDVTLGPNTTVYARASVYKSSNGNVALQGNPAKERTP
jgi:putative colanic acid biosynthesis acetyltransferase WcaF